MSRDFKLTMIIFGAVFLTLSLTPKLPCNPTRAYLILNKSFIRTLNTALDEFRQDVGTFPDKERGLTLLTEGHGISNWNGPYLTPAVIPTDTWGNEFKYDLINGVPIVFSAGKDGEYYTVDDVETSHRLEITP